MRKLLPQISLITILILAIGFFAVPHAAYAQESPGVIDLAISFFKGSFEFFYGFIGGLFWYILIPIAGGIFWLLGQVIDIALTMSFDKAFYDSDAIGLAWSVIRDIANMFFIFILIYEGIKTILNLGNLVTVRKTITSVILAALFLNFSLFFTKAIIDVSNIGATWFMQGIVNIGGDKSSVSNSIGSTLGMQKLVTKFRSATPADMAKIGTQSYMTGILVFILICVSIYVFFNFLFLVIGRIVSFIFLLITAPIGFVGALVPMLQDYSKKWWKELNDQALMLPMFFLMVYLTLFIVDRIQGLLLSTSSDPMAFTPVNYVIFIIIIMMLLKSLKVAQDYSGEIGKMVGGLAKSATTFVGGAALIGTVGRAASAIKSSETMQDWASKSRVGRGLMMGANATANASFGTKSAYGATLKAAGLDKTSLKDQFKGTDKGYEGKKKDEMEQDKKFAELLGKNEKGAARRTEYAQYLKGRGTGILGMTLRGAGAFGIPGATSAAEALQKASGRVAAGEEIIKKDPEIAKINKEANELKRDNIRKEIGADQNSLDKIKTEIEELEAKVKSTPQNVGFTSNAGQINEMKEQLRQKQASVASLEQSIETKKETLKKIGKEIEGQQKAIDDVDAKATLERAYKAQKDAEGGSDKPAKETPESKEGGETKK